MTALASASHDTTETAWGRYCTIRSRPLARGVLAALVGIAVAG